MEASMSEVRVEQKSYQMPPQDGFTIAHFLTVADIERSARFYETVFGGRILSKGDSAGAPGYIQLANIWLIVNVGGGPTPAQPRCGQQLHEYPGCRHQCLLCLVEKARRRIPHRAQGKIRRDTLLYPRS